MSWHDYHAGWLTDAQGIKRMKQNMDDAGGKHVELWFNEGWGFTNTAVDQPIACTHLTSAQSTNEMMASVAEMTIAGQEKTILFHTGYEKHGMSFWDHSGPGTMLWDWYSYPTPLVAAWNVMTHHIGISDEVAIVRPLGANFCVFQDQRNGRGVMVAYADRSAKSDAVVELPDFGAPLTIEDLMGNSGPAPKKLTLSKTGRPVFLYTAAKTPGRVFADKLTPLDRKNASFVRTISDDVLAWNLPPVWEGTEKGSTRGNPISDRGQTLWRIDRLYPEESHLTNHYKPMPWNGTEWHTGENSQGGQPAVRIENGNAAFSVRGPWNGAGLNHAKTAALVFIAPQPGIYRVAGKAKTKPWEGGAQTYKLAILKKDAQRAAEVKAFELPRDGQLVALDAEIELSAGHELVFLPMMQGVWNNATTTTLEGLSVTKK
jgi:hypothetical protein